MKSVRRAATPKALGGSTVAPRNPNRIKTFAAMFASLAFFAAQRAHATPHAVPACTIVGTAAGDILFGTKGRDVICGLGGNDMLDGQGGNDVLVGGLGADQLNGGGGNDVLYGGPGNDKLQGDAGNDSVFGGDGRDTLWAWDGFADRLNGGAGVDRAWKDKLDAVKLVERFG
jgi:Ca2+-binding RTX toxin-like protein